MNLLARIGRRFLFSPPRDFTGFFDFSDDTISGWVVDRFNPDDHAFTISVFYGEEVIAQTRVDEKGEVGWRFVVMLNGRASSADVLYERVRVVVGDMTGSTHTLRLEGSTQLLLINEHSPALTASALLNINFGEGGNSDAFLLHGWSYQEKIHRWTEGTQSSITCGEIATGQDFDLTLLLWPFTVPGRIAEQRLEVRIGEVSVGRFGISRQSFIRCQVPSSSLAGATDTVVHFLHPDAVSLAQLKLGDDPRLLAFAFKNVKLLPARA